MPRPNLLYVMSDHQRADSLGMRQAGLEVTPSLNRLADEGVNFTRAYNACPLCAPARTALATGIYPTANGITFNDWEGRNAGAFKPLHQHLAEAGYEVAHVGVDHIKVKPSYRERIPWAMFVGKAEWKAYLQTHGLSEAPPEGSAPYKRALVELIDGKMEDKKYSNAHTGLWPHDARHFFDLFLAREAEAFLRADRGKPWALFVYLWAPHPPLWVPEPYYSMFDPAKLDLPPNVDRIADGEPANRRQGVPAQLAEGRSETQWRKTWSAHLGLTRLVDDALGLLLAALDESGARERTVTFFCSDHGDHLGQHRMYQKMEMYEQAVRVPFVFRAPGCKPQRVDAPVSHLDVMPTILEACGLPPAKDLDGESLWPRIARNQALARETSGRPVFGMYGGNASHGDQRRMAVTRRWKYIFDPHDVAELYDLETDPLEMKNLAADAAHAGTVKELHAQAKAWAEAHGDGETFSV